VPTLVANWYVWPAAQLINFTVVPLDLRILYVNVVSIAWTAFISNVANSDAAAAPAAPDAPPAGARAGREQEAAAQLAVARGRGRRGRTAAL
jgi:hypothetical protein